MGEFLRLAIIYSIHSEDVILLLKSARRESTRDSDSVVHGIIYTRMRRLHQRIAICAQDSDIENKWATRNFKCRQVATTQIMIQSNLDEEIPRYFKYSWRSEN